MGAQEQIMFQTPLSPSITRSISEKEGDEKLEKTISLEEPSPAMIEKKPIIVFRYYSLKVCCIQSKHYGFNDFTFTKGVA
jgi:hypothetical protein